MRMLNVNVDPSRSCDARKPERGTFATLQAKAHLISLLLHGAILGTFLALPEPAAIRAPALAIDLRFIEPPPACISHPGMGVEQEAAGADMEEPASVSPAPPPLPLEKRDAPPLLILAPEKSKKIAITSKSRLVKPDSAPETRPPPAAAFETRENAPAGSMAAAIAVEHRRSNPAPAVGLPEAKVGLKPGLSSDQGPADPVRDVLFGEGSGPAFVRRILPEYPPQARRRGKEGKVVLRLHIDEQGILKNAEIVESGGPLLDEASLRAARASSYRPAIVQGRPVASTALLPIQFHLNDANGG